MKAPDPTMKKKAVPHINNALSDMFKLPFLKTITNEGSQFKSCLMALHLRLSTPHTIFMVVPTVLFALGRYGTLTT
jgi:hypothetical protein